MLATVTTLKPILGKYHIRGMTACDVLDVAFIEITSKETFWERDDFWRILQESGVQGRVITLKEKIIGHYIFQLSDDCLHLLNLTLFPTFRRQKIGSTIISNLVRDYLKYDRNLLTCHVRDSNTSVHLFFRSNKFRAQNVERAYFVDYDVEDRPHYQDAYYFSYKLDG